MDWMSTLCVLLLYAEPQRAVKCLLVLGDHCSVPADLANMCELSSCGGWSVCGDRGVSNTIDFSRFNRVVSVQAWDEIALLLPVNLIHFNSHV